MVARLPLGGTANRARGPTQVAFVYLPWLGLRLCLIEEAARSIWCCRGSRRLEVGSATMVDSTDLR